MAMKEEYETKGLQSYRHEKTKRSESESSNSKEHAKKQGAIKHAGTETGLASHGNLTTVKRTRSECSNLKNAAARTKHDGKRTRQTVLERDRNSWRHGMTRSRWS